MCDSILCVERVGGLLYTVCQWIMEVLAPCESECEIIWLFFTLCRMRGKYSCHIWKATLLTRKPSEFLMATGNSNLTWLPSWLIWAILTPVEQWATPHVSTLSQTSSWMLGKLRGRRELTQHCGNRRDNPLCELTWHVTWSDTLCNDHLPAVR